MVSYNKKTVVLNDKSEQISALKTELEQLKAEVKQMETESNHAFMMEIKYQEELDAIVNEWTKNSYQNADYYEPLRQEAIDKIIECNQTYLDLHSSAMEIRDRIGDIEAQIAALEN
jgi:uncharacterized small protein (DUF1192 family)